MTRFAHTCSFIKKHLTGNVHILGHSLTVLISRAVLLKKKKRAKPHIQSPTGHVYSFHHSPFKVVIAGPQKHINISCCHHYNHLKVLSASELTFICLHFHKASNEKIPPLLTFILQATALPSSPLNISFIPRRAFMAIMKPAYS